MSIKLRIMPYSETPRRRRRESDDDDTPRRRSSSKKLQGWGAVAHRQAEISEREDELKNIPRDFFLKEGESATIQFLQDEPFCYDAHSVKDKRGNFRYVPCQLNTGKHCVMCAEGVKLTWRAAFKLIDYRGTWDKNKARFKNDTPVEKIWKVGTTVAQQLKAICDKRGKELTEMVFEVHRSGSGKDATYNFEQALDEDDTRMRPKKWVEKMATAEELCQPPTVEDIDKAGYTDAD